jgi:hypothetical protein
VFVLTPDAARAINLARDEAGAPAGWGVRFCAALEDPTGISLEFVDGPQINDIIGGSDELRTYVEMAVHRKVGDATVDYADTGGSAGLVIRPHRELHASSRPPTISRA